MPVYICRWPNGDFSAVSATDRDQAIYLLDEVDNADRAEVFRAPSNFMVHFRLIDKVRDPQEFWPVELEGFGEATNELAGRLYPKYHEAKDVLAASEDSLLKNAEVPTSDGLGTWQISQAQRTDQTFNSFSEPLVISKRLSDKNWPPLGTTSGSKMRSRGDCVARSQSRLEQACSPRPH